MKPILYIVIPCYNEEDVLPITSPMFKNKIDSLVSAGKISEMSRVLFVDDGSRDDTWNIISRLSDTSPTFLGISLSRNRGHQHALLAGLMEAKKYADITISIDCDGQDDINAMDLMVDEYLAGSQIVYGVRTSRETDTFFKRNTAQGFYRILSAFGVETVYNHADYRLLSKEVLEALSQYKETNLYLRGLIPLIGYRSSTVGYERTERLAGVGHYPLKKMLSLAFEGVTSLSIKPVRLILNFGIVLSALSLVATVVTLILAIINILPSLLPAAFSAICLLFGITITAVGVVGEYVGKVYGEVKARPRYFVEKRTFTEKE
ncbi:MAG: glycosyltransferase family 2 protein [Clostridia bacterium]|nr:glycosyltransferase family 2 protein [Clostridia bacterium]